jgi:hypothetical protein
MSTSVATTDAGMTTFSAALLVVGKPEFSRKVRVSPVRR